MSGDPKRTPEETMEPSMDDIIAQALAYTGPSPPEEKPQRKGPRKPFSLSPAWRKNKFVYLTVLFAAAFLILLICFLVQRRGSGTQLDGLRDSIDAQQDSIDDLQATIDALTEENQKLTESNQRISEQATQTKKQYEEALEDLTAQVDKLNLQNTADSLLWYLEQFYDEGDDIMAACLIESFDYWVREYGEKYLLQSQLDFYTQYQNDLLKRGFLTNTSSVLAARDPQNRTTTEAVASVLWLIFEFGFEGRLDSSAFEIEGLNDPQHPEYIAALYSGAFSDFTVSQYETLRDRAVELGWLIKTDTGYSFTFGMELAD